MSSTVRCLILGLLALLAAGAAAAGEPVTWRFTAETSATDTVRVQLAATCEAGWHIYALTLPTDEGLLPTVVQLDRSDAYTPAGGPQEPRPEEQMDPNFGMVVRFHGGNVIFSQAVRRTTGQAFRIHGGVEYMACNDKTCLPPHTVPFTLDIPASR